MSVDISITVPATLSVLTNGACPLQEYTHCLLFCFPLHLSYFEHRFVLLAVDHAGPNVVSHHSCHYIQGV